MPSGRDVSCAVEFLCSIFCLFLGQSNAKWWLRILVPLAVSASGAHSAQHALFMAGRSTVRSLVKASRLRGSDVARHLSGYFHHHHGAGACSRFSTSRTCRKTEQVLRYIRQRDWVPLVHGRSFGIPPCVNGARCRGSTSKYTSVARRRHVSSAAGSVILGCCSAEMGT